MKSKNVYVHGIFGREYGDNNVKCLSLHSKKKNALKRKARLAKEECRFANVNKYVELWGPIKLKVEGLSKLCDLCLPSNTIAIIEDLAND